MYEDVCRHQTHVCYKKGNTFMVWEASGLGSQSSLARLPLNLLQWERVRPNRLYNSCLPNLWFMITILKMCNFSEQSMYKCPIFQLLPTLLLGCLCCFILLCILFEQLLLLLSLPLLTTKTTLFDTVPPSLCLVAIATNNHKIHYVRLIQLFLKYHHC